MAVQQSSQYRNAKFTSTLLGLIALACLVFTLALEYAQASEASTQDHIGKISGVDLLSRYPAFAEEYEKFEPSKEQLSQIRSLAGKEIITLFGTWCHDSKREVPRLLKLLDMSQVEVKELTLYAVSRQKDDPDGYSEKYALEYTPTIVVAEQGHEVARIIERPEGTLASDLAKQINP